MQELNPMPWGALDRYQAHFIVRKDSDSVGTYVAKTQLTTKGHFGSKTIENVHWNGPGSLATKLKLT